MRPSDRSAARSRDGASLPFGWTCLLLAGITAAAYAKVGSLGFVNMDDPLYVSRNPSVLAGLSGPGIAWAFTTTSQTNWHPLTWLSLMLDASIGGADPRIYHCVNLLFHLANTVLLFAFLDRTTGDRAPSAFVAALFAVHPLHVESVAWVAERKDVLSTLFFLLTLVAYAGYAKRPSPRRYAAVLAMFVAGLMAKPMLVSVPIVLLLLDLWPLRRWGAVPARTLVLEKLPFVLGAAASSVITLIVQRPAMERLEAVPFGVRAANAALSYCVYLGQTLWPKGLAIFYPYPRELGWSAAAAALLVAGLTAGAILTRRARPWLAVGWAWYLVTLVPVLGLVQVGIQARADRYTYIPLIGIFVAVAWGGREVLRRLGVSSLGTRAAAALVVTALAAATWRQVGHWRSSIELFSHAVAVTRDNVLAHFNLSDAYSAEGNTAQEMAHLREAYRIDPRFPDAHFNLTGALIRQRSLGEVEALCREELRWWPTAEQTLVNFGILALLQGDYDAAETRLLEALRVHPGSVVAQHNLTVARAARARAAGAGR